MNEEIHSINKVNSSPRIGTTINSTARKSSEEERVFYRVDLSPDAVHAIRLDSKATTPIPFSPPPCNYHRLLQFATANTPCTMHVPFVSQLFPPSREILLSWRVPSLRRKLFANSLALAKVSGEFARLKLCGDGLRGCWESNRRFCRIINITWTTLTDFQYFFRCFLKIQRSVNEI